MDTYKNVNADVEAHIDPSRIGASAVNIEDKDGKLAGHDSLNVQSLSQEADAASESEAETSMDEVEKYPVGMATIKYEDYIADMMTKLPAEEMAKLPKPEPKFIDTTDPNARY